MRPRLDDQDHQGYNLIMVASNTGMPENGDTVESIGSTSTEDLRGLSLYEKKSILINREIDRMGMGRYQWYLFFLAAGGYTLDLLYAESLALIANPLQQEFGLNGVQISNIFVSFSAGLCAGAFVWGILLDIVGRRWAFNLTVLIASVFGLALGGPSNYEAIVVLTAFTGIGIGGNIPIDTIVFLEVLPSNRHYLLALLSVFQPVGVVLCCVLAYGFIPTFSCDASLPACKNTKSGEACCRKGDNMGWRYLVFCLGAITLTLFFLRFVIFTFHESPKYLLYRGRDEEAINVLHRIAALNRQPCSLTIENFDELVDDESATEYSDLRRPTHSQGTKGAVSTGTNLLMKELRRAKILFSTFQMARLTILTWITYAFDYWGFTIAGSFLPLILAKKNAVTDVPLRTTYRNYIIIYAPGIVAVLISAALYQIPRWGRQMTLIVSSALMGASLFIFTTINTQASSIGINAMEYFFQSLFNATLYAWASEAFPAPIRGTAVGFASGIGRLFAIISPLIAGHLYDKNINAVLYLAGGGVFICTVATALLPASSMTGKSI